MKKYLLLSIAIISCTYSFAKKVKFSVDMDTVTVLSTGVHVMGDFQMALGCTVDFDPACTPLTQEASTTIYSTVIDIPAFAVYTYIFVNGDQSYEVESIPYQSIVGYNFNQNRWMYVDSLADDTTDIGAVIFRQNAPAGLTLIRFKVDMHEEASISPNGVHVAGNFQGFDPTKIRMYSFGSGVYEIIYFLPAGTHEFKYYNGNTIGDEEIIPGACSVNSHREVVLSIDTIMHDSLTGFPVCFGSCVACLSASVGEINSSSGINIYPNPARNKLAIGNGQLAIGLVSIYDATGRIVFSQEQKAKGKRQTDIDISTLMPGIYFVRVSDADNKHITTSKLIIE